MFRLFTDDKMIVMFGMGLTMKLSDFAIIFKRTRESAIPGPCWLAGSIVSHRKWINESTSGLRSKDEKNNPAGIGFHSMFGWL